MGVDVIPEYEGDQAPVKELQPDNVIVESLIRLRNEMWDRKDPNVIEIFFKINSCLYRGYGKQ